MGRSEFPWGYCQAWVILFACTAPSPGWLGLPWPAGSSSWNRLREVASDPALVWYEGVGGTEAERRTQDHGRGGQMLVIEEAKE